MSTETRPTTDQVIPLVNELYGLPGAEVGGPLHVVLDDGNLETYFIQSCIDDKPMHSYSAEVLVLSKRIAEAMLQMTMTQRRKVYRSFTR